MVEFYRETEFKEAEIGRIPKDWSLRELEKLCHKIKAGGTPLTRIRDYWDGDIPFVKIEDLTSSGKYLYSTKTTITKLGLEKSSAWLVPPGSILFAMYGSIGAVSINKIPVATNQAILGIIPNQELIDTEFLYYVLKFLTPFFERCGLRTTQKNLAAYIVRRAKIPLPPLKEQKLIARILYSMDEAIRAVDDSIAKYERLKKGLMQELLTKGIGHKEFKEEAGIGRIPASWDVVKLKEVVREVKVGFACGKRDENGVIQLRMDSITTDGRINPKAYVKVPAPANLKEYLLRPGDILFNNTNSRELVGKTAIFRGEHEICTFSNHLTRIRVREDVVLPEWILYDFIRKWKLGIFRAICHPHVQQAGIGKYELLNLKIPLPPIDEQERITKILLSVDAVLEEKRQKKARLERMKKALMDLLLTGKVRVRA